jgi:type IV pilus assembly protein PilQ
VTNQTSTVCTPQKTDAGLSFGAKINKIDDNGFVTFSMSPEISAQLPGGLVPGCGPFFNIAKRRLDTGTLRVRDGQTLVLTGVINEDIQTTVSKWPILGDLPIIGQFFRSTGANRGKNELVILVTPRILREDDSADPYGYGYRPSSQEARQFMGGY